jgi:HlyD family secretion protein
MSTADVISLKGPQPRAPSPGSEPKVEVPSGGKRPTKKRNWGKPALILLCILILGGAGGWYWWQQHLQELPPGIAKANGRLESEQVEIATKYAGRIAEVFAKEGQMVKEGEILARMDTKELEAQLAAADAKVKQAKHQKKQAAALIVQRESERTFAQKELFRAETLHKQGWATGEKLDQRQDQLKTAEAAYDTAIANRDAAEAEIVAAQAEVARLQSQIDDSTLDAPRPGRIQYKLAQPGEVLTAGGRVLTLLDLSDVYLTIFLPARDAGRLAIGDEARVVLDVAPQYVFPANVTFVATEAQFTPKTVETSEEREKLMFRVKLSIDPELRTRYENQVKTGLRGVGYVKTVPNTPWPENLAVKLP